jgi:hypothetical protein
VSDLLTLADLHAELAPVRADVAALRLDMVRLEAKVDSKPGLVAMFGAVMVVVLGFASVAASTVAVLHTLGFIRVPA